MVTLQIIFFTILYMVPSIIAFFRKKRNRWALFSLNTFPSFEFLIVQLLNFINEDLNLSIDLDTFVDTLIYCWLVSFIWSLLWENKEENSDITFNI